MEYNFLKLVDTPLRSNKTVTNPAPLANFLQWKMEYCKIRKAERFKISFILDLS